MLALLRTNVKLGYEVEEKTLLDIDRQHLISELEDADSRKAQQLQTIFAIAEVLAGPADFHTKAEAVTTIIKDQLNADGVAALP